MHPDQTPRRLTRRGLLLSGGGVALSLTAWPYLAPSFSAAASPRLPAELEAIYSALVEALNSVARDEGHADPSAAPGRLRAYLAQADDATRERVASVLTAVQEAAGGRFAELPVADRVAVLRDASRPPGEHDLDAAVAASTIVTAISLSAVATMTGPPIPETLTTHLVNRGVL